MINGIIQSKDGFALKDFEGCKVISDIGDLHFVTYEEAVDKCCGVYYPVEYRPYLKEMGELRKTGRLEKEPDADVWENLIYADDYRGVWDGERKEYRDVTSMDKGAAADDEIAYVDALAITYDSLRAMVK